MQNKSSLSYNIWYWNNISSDRIVHLEETYTDHQVQMPDQFRANQKLNHMTKCIIQMPLEHWQHGASTSEEASPSVSPPSQQRIFPYCPVWAGIGTALCCSHMSYFWLLVRRDQHLPLCFVSSGSCRKQWGCLSASSSPDWITQESSGSRYLPPRPCLYLALLHPSCRTWYVILFLQKICKHTTEHADFHCRMQGYVIATWFS